MDETKTFRADLATAMQNPNLLKDVAGIGESIKLLEFSISLAEKGVAVTACIPRDARRLLPMLGEPFRKWIEKASAAVVESDEMQSAVLDLKPVIDNLMGGAKNG